VNQCNDLLYDVIWSCFGSLVPKTSQHCTQKFPWVKKELISLKNKATRAAKRMKKGKRRYMIDDDIDDGNCERLRDDFTAFGTEYQKHHERAYDDYRIGIEEAIKTDPRSFLGTLISRKSGWVIHRS
jgi:hypothetical protein